MSAGTELEARGRARLAELELSGTELGAAGALARAVGYSDFLHGLLIRLGPMGAPGFVRDARDLPTRAAYRQLCAERAPAAAVESGLGQIALRELTGLQSVRTSLLASSLLAEAVLGRVLEEEGAITGLTVFGLGKLGGRELNFFSDLDLVFATTEPTDERNELAAIRTAQRVLGRLDGGFRIDLRLRPFGQSGPLLMGFAAMEAYFQNHGREWERYAWIKARAVAGHVAAGREFLRRLRPFLYRRYLDYHAIEALREMKLQIASEAGESELDIKGGPGGIREVEFVVQVFQLVRGGRSPELVGPRLAGALAGAVRLGLLSKREGSALEEAYRFLRRVENRLQMQNLSPQHKLPDNVEQQLRLAGSLGFASWTAFWTELERHRSTVRRTFAAVFAEHRPETEGRGLGAELWNTLAEPEQAQALLMRVGFRDLARSRGSLAAFRGSRSVRLMSARGRRALDRIMPLLLEQLSLFDEPDAALARILGLLSVLVRRSPYLALLAERPTTFQGVVRLAGRSDWLARRLAAAPIALDELLDPRLNQPANRRRLSAEIAHVVALETDPGGAADRLRDTNEMQRMKIAAGFMEGYLSADEAERSLTLLAELSVRTAFMLASRQMCARHGTLRAQVLAIAYGKLGSRELGFASDLDLVFVYCSEASSSSRGLAADTYVARLAQRVISLLSLPTAAGALYGVDTRLRPEGSAGLLLSRFEGWRRYQREQARLWERQALLKARPVAGSATLARLFVCERRDLLAAPFARRELAHEIVAMRRRVATSGPARPANASALIDGEFLAAYWVLRAAGEIPAALRPSRTADQLAALAAGGHPPEAMTLAAALSSLRAANNRSVLGLGAEEYLESQARAEIGRLWRVHLAEAEGAL